MMGMIASPVHSNAPLAIISDVPPAATINILMELLLVYVEMESSLIRMETANKIAG